MDQESEDYSEGEDTHDVSQPPEEDDSTSKTLATEVTSPKLAASTARLFLHGIYPQIFSHKITSATYAGIESEAKIDEMSRKIDQLCKVINRPDHLLTPMSTLTTSAPNTHTPVSATATSSPLTAAQGQPLDDTTPPDLEHEGESSISAHTAFASKFLQNAVSRDPSTPIPHEIDTLRRAAEKPHQRAEDVYEQLPLARKDVLGSGLPLPPAHLAFAVLRMLKEYSAFKYFWAFELESAEQFSEYFFRVYSTSAASTADRIIVYLGLYWLFAECSWISTDLTHREDYKQQSILCREGAETLLASLPFHLPPSFSYVLALSMAATYTLEKCKPLLTWNFIGTAARMMHAVGGFGTPLAESKDPQTTRRKNRLLTVIYMHDQGLCLRLGRPAAIGFAEVTDDYKQWLGDLNSVYSVIVPKWIKVARLQRKTYDWLYSRAALDESVQVRSQRAQILTRELHNIQEESKSCSVEIQYKHDLQSATSWDVHEFLCRGERVSELSLDCLIHRNIHDTNGSGRPFGDSCIALARESLLEHRGCMEGLGARASCFLGEYINWAILASPFVPFIVILCNVVETLNLDDLELLKATISSVEDVSEVSQAAAKQLKLFQPLYEVASKYVEAKTCAFPNDDSFGAFLDEMNVDEGMPPTFMSTLQGHPLDAANHGNPAASNAAMFDLWSFLDTPPQP